MTFETFDQSDEETGPNQKRDNNKDKDKDKDNHKEKYVQRAPSRNDPRDLWPLRHLIRVVRRHDLTKKIIMTKTNTKTKTMTKTNTFREHLQRAILETCDLSYIWSERWGDITTTMTNTGTKTKTMTNTLIAPSKSIPSDLWHLRHWLHFWQLRTWILDNLCYLTIKSDTGQHSQFLRCFSTAQKTDDLLCLDFLFVKGLFCQIISYLCSSKTFQGKAKFEEN